MMEKLSERRMFPYIIVWYIILFRQLFFNKINLTIHRIDFRKTKDREKIPVMTSLKKYGKLMQE